MFTIPRPETGRLDDLLPYARVGTGDRPLVVIPGLEGAMFDGEYTRSMARALQWYYARFTADYEVSVVSRQRGLPGWYRFSDMADDYAAALRAEVGSADVLGVSLGGMVAQELAIRHPDVVERLVLASSGCRIGGLEAVRRFRRYAREGHWSSVRAGLSAAAYSDWRALAYPLLASTLGRWTLPEPSAPSDVLVTLEAAEAFDAADRLPRVAAPTLVVGGDADPLFPEALLRETAATVPDGRLSLVTGARHGAIHERKPVVDERVARFLAGTPPSPAVVADARGRATPPSGTGTAAGTGTGTGAAGPPPAPPIASGADAGQPTD